MFLLFSTKYSDQRYHFKTKACDLGYNRVTEHAPYVLETLDAIPSTKGKTVPFGYNIVPLHLGTFGSEVLHILILKALAGFLS